MSKYRDDMNDTLVIGDVTWAGLRSVAESTVYVSDKVMFGLPMLLVDSAALGDQVFDRTRRVVDEHVTVADAVIGRATLRTVVLERLRASDSVASGTESLVSEVVLVSDELILSTRAAVSESVRLSDTVLGRRMARQLVAEHAKVSDSVPFRASQLIEEAATLASTTMDRLRARTLVADSVVLGDALAGGFTSGPAIVTELVRIGDMPLGVLHARDLVNDMALAIWDEALQPGADVGQAWTAPTSGWATSRYAPFTFTSMAVIDGVAHGTGAGGVFALDGHDEPMTALLRTGRLDVTNGTLVRLVEAPMEYELDGTAALDVTETQNGVAPETYTYEPDARDALVLTNSRFQLGRGLKGRHFTFALSLQGRRGYINDLRVTVAPSKRSM